MLDLEMLNLSSNYIVKYDAWNRLSTVADGSTMIQTNRYDGLHRRVSRESNTTGVRHFYLNSFTDKQVEFEMENVLASTDDALKISSSPDPFSSGMPRQKGSQRSSMRTGTSTTADRQYVWHPYYIDALAISYNSSGTAHYYVQDGNFNVTAAMDSSGAVVERYSTTPYGECIVLNTDFTLDSSSGGDGLSDIANEFTYTGRRLDVETGLYQYRHRYYHAQLGRFVNRDPIGYVDGLNTYCCYFGVTQVDPFGTTVQGQWPPPAMQDPNPSANQDLGAFCGVGFQFVTATPKDPIDGVRNGLFTRWINFSTFQNAWTETVYERASNTLNIVSQHCGADAVGSVTFGFSWEFSFSLGIGVEFGGSGPVTGSLWSVNCVTSFAWAWGNYVESTQELRYPGERCTIFKIVPVVEKVLLRTERFHFAAHPALPHTYVGSQKIPVGYLNHVKSIVCKMECKE